MGQGLNRAVSGQKLGPFKRLGKAVVVKAVNHGVDCRRGADDKNFDRLAIGF